MKTILLIVVLLFCSTIYTQSKEKAVVLKSEVKVISSQSSTYYIDSAMLAKKDQPTIDTEKTVAYYDNYIQAIEIKINAIQADPIQAAEAEKNGWFIQMNGYLEKARNERSVLIGSK